MSSSTPKVLHTRQYARHWAVPISASTTASDCKAKWYSVRIHTGIVATNTSGHYLIQVPRPHRNEWINWRKLASVANSQAIVVATSSFLATLLKLKLYSKRSDRRLSSLIRSGRINNQSFKIH